MRERNIDADFHEDLVLPHLLHKVALLLLILLCGLLIFRLICFLCLSIFFFNPVEFSQELRQFLGGGHVVDDGLQTNKRLINILVERLGDILVPPAVVDALLILNQF